MKLEGRRESTNVDDRRMSGGAKAGVGIGTLVIAALVTWLLGGNPLSVLQNAEVSNATSQKTQTTEFTEEEQELATFSKKILAGTEDVWTAYFQKNGLGEYTPPTMVLFSGSVQSGCGNASASVGPFYCSADKCLYIDLSFFSSMKQQLGADGDFAYAYVIAHEVGHHVQDLLGILDTAHKKMAQMSTEDANRISVRLELQADFLAGVWAYHDNEMFKSLEDGDIEEAINCASVIGDDYLQKKARGYAVEDSFTHGTAAQRMKWLKKGLSTGDINQGNTFAYSDRDL